jgi:rfaE bifunctional protein kinase chain/domain
MIPSRPRPGRLLDLISAFEGKTAAVLGDLVLDEFVYGEIARVSREAPVLILDHRVSRLAPGGAANAVANLRALGARPLPVGRIGADEAGGKIAGLLTAAGVDCSLLVRDPSYTTPVKSRILAGSPHTAKQQIVRLDRGAGAAAPSAAVTGRLGRSLARARKKAAGLLVADYGYGSARPDDGELGRWIAEGPSPVTLDSRFRLLDFRGIAAATPNIAEVEAALGVRIPDDDPAAIERAGAALRRRLRCRALLVTRGSRGMSLFEEGRRPAHIPPYGTDEVADVTGAGDTVAATFLLALLAGGSFLEAATLANTAGGIVVTKRGTATVSPAEMAAAVESEE